MNEYTNEVKNRFFNPKYIGSMDEKDNSVGVGNVGSLSCGDIMKIFIKVDLNTLMIEDVKILIFGCASAFASGDLMAELLINKHIDNVIKITNKEIAKTLGLPKIKIHCSVLAEETIHLAVNDFLKKNNLKQYKEKINDINFVQQKINDQKIKDQNETINEIVSEKKDINFDQNDIELNNKLDNSKINIEITEQAKINLAKFFEDKQDHTLYLSIINSKCGYTYTYYITKINNLEKEEYKIIDYDGFSITVKKINIIFFKSIKIDYIFENLKQYIVINKKDKISLCDCGQKFK